MPDGSRIVRGNRTMKYIFAGSVDAAWKWVRSQVREQQRGS
jgi:hypothetical protein